MCLDVFSDNNNYNMTSQVSQEIMVYSRKCIMNRIYHVISKMECIKSNPKSNYKNVRPKARPLTIWWYKRFVIFQIDNIDEDWRLFLLKLVPDIFIWF